jgi:uracil-DNA glycosylase
MSAISARDAAFLAEMGIGPLWSLRNGAATGADVAEGATAPVDAHATTVPVQAAPVLSRLEAPPYSQPQPAPVRDPATTAAAAEPTDEEIARMDWDQLHAAIASCTRCGGCKDGRKPVFGDGARQANWFIAAGASTLADEQAGAPLAGDTGTLLDNMLFAAGAARAADAYVTNLVKCRPVSAKGGDRAPTTEEAAACRPFVERELALTGASKVLTLGQIAANGLLGKELAEPLANSRGEVHQLAGVPLVATLHPGELLRRGADKALAWADLCRAKAAHARPG